MDEKVRRGLSNMISKGLDPLLLTLVMNEGAKSQRKQVVSRNGQKKRKEKKTEPESILITLILGVVRIRPQVS